MSEGAAANRSDDGNNRNVPLARQLIDAVEAENVDDLRRLLSLLDDQDSSTCTSSNKNQEETTTTTSSSNQKEESGCDKKEEEANSSSSSSNKKEESGRDKKEEEVSSSTKKDSVAAVAVVAVVAAGAANSNTNLINSHPLRSPPPQRKITDWDIDDALVEAARRGHLESCSLLMEKVSFRGRDKYLAIKNFGNESPLQEAALRNHVDLVDFFVTGENGKTMFNVNQVDTVQTGWHRTAISCAVTMEHAETCRVLLVNGADPNKGMAMDMNSHRHYSSLCHSVLVGSADILALLFEHGAKFNGDTDLRDLSYALDVLLRGREVFVRGAGMVLERRRVHLRSDRKLSICRLLIQHVTRNALGNQNGTAAAAAAAAPSSKTNEEENAASAAAAAKVMGLLFARAKKEISDTFYSHSATNASILFAAGLPVGTWAMPLAVQAGQVELCRLLMRQYSVDPFRQVQEDGNSPFYLASHLEATAILDVFLRHWDERYATNAGKNEEGFYPIQVLARDVPQVSIQAIHFVVERQTDTLTSKKQGLYPFHLAAAAGASLDVIYYLLKRGANHLVELTPKLQNASL